MLSLLLAGSACSGGGGGSRDAKRASPGTSAAGSIPDTSIPAPSSSVPVPTTTPVVPQSPVPERRPPVKLTSDTWTLESFATGADGAGNWTGTAPITNGGNDARSATFEITLSRGDRPIASLTGRADGVGGGQTVTVAFTSGDRFSDGPYQVQFKAGSGFGF